MKISAEKKESVVRYILEKIEQGEPGLSKHVSEALGVNQSTVHSYLNELVEKGVIKRVKRGSYELSGSDTTIVLSRSAGELESEMTVYQQYLMPIIKDLPQNVRDIWAYAFSEMVNNVIDHSSADRLCISIRRNYLNTTVILADNGVGIFTKIMSYFHLDSMEDAICELVKGRLTTDKENHSGEGIFFTSKLMDAFLIVSEGKVFSRDKYDSELLRDFDSQLPGTTVFMTLSNFSKKYSHEVFDLCSNEDYSFTKTILPLKMIFDASPVSRSQAKRVCNRLEQFSDVTLDFEGIDWMGQGFAHQIFVLFQKSHPEVTLHPIHMSAEVEQMYRHVIGN